MSQVASELQQQLALASTMQEKDKESSEEATEKKEEKSEEKPAAKEEKPAAPKVVAVPLPSVELPPKPQEAILLEAEIKKLKKQLVQLRQKNFADLESEEKLRAEYDNRAPKYPKELIEDEE